MKKLKKAVEETPRKESPTTEKSRSSVETAIDLSKGDRKKSWQENSSIDPYMKRSAQALI